MKNKWPMVKISKMALILRGSGLSKKDIDLSGSNKCILYGQLYTLYGPVIEEVESRTNVEGKMFSVIGDVLVPGTTTADAMGIAVSSAVNEKGVIIGGDINIIRTENRQINSKFLSYLLNQPYKNQLAQHARGTNIIHLSGKDIGKIKIPVPPLKIQQKIVERLDAIKKAQELNALQISKTDELFESIVKRNIIDNKSKQVLINDVCLKQEFYNPENSPDKEFIYIDISAINSSSYSIITDKIKRIKGADAPSRARKKISAGDIIFSTVRPNLKRIAEIPEDLDGAIVSTGFTVLKPDDEKVNRKYFSLTTCSGITTKQVLPRIRGANYPAVTDKDIFETKIPLPPLPEQQKIVSKLNTIQDYKKLLLKQKNLLQELFDSVLQKSMKGEFEK